MRLVSAPWIVPVVTPPIRDGAVLLGDGAHGDGIDDNTIVAVGRRADLLRLHGALPETRAEGTLCPGLVNAHAHLELSSLAGAVPGGDGVVAWTRRLAPRLAARAAESASVDESALRAAHDAQRFGTAALADVGNGTAGWRAMAQVGLKGTFFHELVGSREARTGDALADAAAERAGAQAAAADRLRDIPAVPAPHAPYSVGPDLMRRIFAAAAAAGRATTIHLAEDGDEIDLLRAGAGAWPAVLEALGVPPGERVPRLGPAAYLESLGAFAAPPPPLLVHMVHADADDRRRARAAGATVVLCPRSNLHIGGRLPDVPALIADGLRLAMGTDSLASVPDLSLWAEMATLAIHFPQVAPRAWLAAATMGGAAALGLARLGSLAPGQRPGLLDVIAYGGGGSHDGGDEDPERALLRHPSPTLRWMASP
ncbi:MAG: amidohydrolase family protein [Bacteroidota bacterium]